MYGSKPKSFWEKVLWTDETKVELFGQTCHCAVYQKGNEAYKGKNTVPTVEYGRGSKRVGVVLLPLKIAKGFWVATLGPVSESCVCVLDRGSFSRTMIPNIPGSVWIIV